MSEQHQSSGIWAELVAFVKTLVIILGLALLIRIQIVEPFKIPSGSMKPTLQIGDYILVLKFWYGLRRPEFHTPDIRMGSWHGIPYPIIRDSGISMKQFVTWQNPKRGDVVVFTRPDDPSTPYEDDSQIHIIKRVVGLPGELVEVRGAHVFINGEPLDEPYARWVHGGGLEGDFGPQTVPEGHVLLLGDNRDESKDSRFWTVPFLDEERIKGRAVIVFWSFDSLSRIGNLIR